MAIRRFGTLWLYSILLLSSGCGHLFYHPDSTLYSDPVQAGYVAPERIEFNSMDGNPLWGWYFKAEGKPKGTIIQFHGNGQNLTSHYLFLAWLTHEGYNLFAFDYRGYGESPGEPSAEGTHADGIAALSWAMKRHQEASPGTPFIVVGQSLGGAIAMKAVDEFPAKDSIALLVLDSTFSSYPRVARRLMAERWWLWPFSWLSYLLVSNEYGTEEAIGRNKIPLLVIHDRRDPRVSFENGEEIYQLATRHLPQRTEFWIFDQGLHTGAFTAANEWYRHQFLHFLENLTKS